jgi:hypothetical protein
VFDKKGALVEIIDIDERDGRRTAPAEIRARAS